MKIVQSSDNKYLKLLKSLQNKKYRDKNAMFFDEGIKNIELSLKSDYEIEFVVIKDYFDDKILEDIKQKIEDEKILCVSEKIFDTLSDTKNSQGIIAVYNKKINKEKIDSKKILILDKLQDPGNVGTIIRTADAFGVDTICYIKGTVDIYSPKVVRSTMGSVYFVDFYEIDDVSTLQKNGYILYASCLEDSISIKDEFTDDKIALIIGNEANGISDELIEKSDKKIKIEMNGNAQSLNVGVATGILIYEMMMR